MEEAGKVRAYDGTIGGVAYSEVLYMVCEGRLKMSFRRPLVWLERGSLERLHTDAKFA